MGIRLKLALVMSATVAAATVAAVVSFARLQARAVERSQQEEIRLLLGTIQQSADESILSGDPLVLLDQLAFLKRERPELSRCRVLWKGQWHEAGGKPVPEPEGGVLRRFVAVPATGSRPGISIEADLSLSALQERVHRERAALERSALKAGLGVAALGLIVSAILAAALTRRIVKIEHALDAIGEGKLGTGVSVGGSDEIARLARGVTGMSDRLKELDEMKRAFTASVTHELRSPLGAIQSQARLVLSKPEGLSDAAVQSLERIGANAQRLEHFVTSLLEMARIERGKLDFTARRADFGKVIEDVALFFAPPAKEMGIELTCEVAPGLPPMTFDPDLITQVATNLIANAIKFTPSKGRVVVKVRPFGSGGVCEIEDTGIGIPQGALARLFKPFERAANARGAKGTGLGLALSKGIIDLHGGTITAESEAGKGSRFRFELPAVPPSKS